MFIENTQFKLSTAVNAASALSSQFWLGPRIVYVKVVGVPFMKKQQAMRGLMSITGALLILSFQNCAKVQPTDLRAAGIPDTAVGDLSAGTPNVVPDGESGSQVNPQGGSMTPNMPGSNSNAGNGPTTTTTTTTSTSSPTSSSGGNGNGGTVSHQTVPGQPTMHPPTAPSTQPEIVVVSPPSQPSSSTPDTEDCEPWDPSKVQASLGKKHHEHDGDDDDDHDGDHDKNNEGHGSKSCDHNKSQVAKAPKKVCAPDESKAVAACLKSGAANVIGDRVANRSGRTVIDADNMRSIENVSGTTVVRGGKGGGRISSIKNVSGSLVLCDMEVDSMEDISGHLVLVNTHVKHLENQSGNRKLTNSSIDDQSNVSGHLAQNH